MPALHAGNLPPPWRSALDLLRRRRPGLADPAALPLIERAVREARIDPGWLRRYRLCVGLAPQDDAMLPPLALQVAAAPLHLAILADPRFPFPALGLIHQAQRVIQYRPVPAGALLALRACCTDARLEKCGMSFCLLTEAHCAGELVWCAQTQALARQRQAAPVRLAGSADRGPALAQPADREQLLPVPESCGRRYAAIAGDLNPIHQHALLARPFGLRRAIVHGTWTLARALASMDLPGTGSYQLDARFVRPVELPSEILVRVWAQPDGQCLRVLDAQGGRTHVDALLAAVA